MVLVVVNIFRDMESRCRLLPIFLRYNQMLFIVGGLNGMESTEMIFGGSSRYFLRKDDLLKQLVPCKK